MVLFELIWNSESILFFRLTTDLDKIMGHLKEKPQMDGKPVDQTPAGLLIISLITSNMRAAKTIASKFVCYSFKKLDCLVCPLLMSFLFSVGSIDDCCFFDFPACRHNARLA